MPQYSPSDRYPDHPIVYNIFENGSAWRNFKDQYSVNGGERRWLHVSLPLVNAIDVDDSDCDIRFKSEKDITYFILKYS